MALSSKSLAPKKQPKLEWHVESGQGIGWFEPSPRQVMNAKATGNNQVANSVESWLCRVTDFKR